MLERAETREPRVARVKDVPASRLAVSEKGRPACQDALRKFPPKVMGERVELA